MAIKRTLKVDAYLTQLNEIKNYFEKMQATRENIYENRSENWQESEKGETEQENIDSLEAINEKLSEAFDELEELFDETML